MSHETILEFREGDREVVTSLWEACGLIRPWNDPNLDIDRNVSADSARLFVAEVGHRVVGSIMVGYDGHRGWVNYLAVAPTHRGSGIGRRLMEHAEHHLADLGCPKVNLQIRVGNVAAIAFYERLGFTVDDAVSMGKRLVHDAAPHR